MTDDMIPRSEALAMVAAALDENGLTPGQLDDACLTYRHDFGLLDSDTQSYCRHTAKEWWKALARARTDADALAALEAVKEGEYIRGWNAAISMGLSFFQRNMTDDPSDSQEGEG